MFPFVNYSISCFLLLKQSFFKFLLNNDCQWTEAKKDELNFQHRISSHISKIKHSTKQDL